MKLVNALVFMIPVMVGVFICDFLLYETLKSSSLVVKMLIGILSFTLPYGIVLLLSKRHWN